MPRKLRTKGGNTKRRKHVKLDTSGLKNFAGTFGKNGQTFTVGIFDAVNATKGWKLEYGTDPGDEQPYMFQVPRPWLSSIMFSGTTLNKDILKAIKRFVLKTLEGTDAKARAKEEITRAVKDSLWDQLFMEPLAPLRDTTIDIKTKKKSTFPRKIGIDTGDMLNAIQTRSSGGTRRKLSKE